MIAFLIALLLTLSSGSNPCDLGKSIDWYAWEDAHTAAKLVFTLSATDTTSDIWLYNDANEYVLFVFKEPIGSTSGEKHGQCSRDVSGDING